MSENLKTVTRITPAELTQIKEAKTKAIVAATVAERTVAQANLAKSEAENLVLRICIKYGLDPDRDNIMEDGQLARANESDPVKEV